MCGDTIFVQESKAVCMRIAVDVMRLQVREPGCVDDPMNDNALVHMTCRLDSPGATDPGTGLRTSGYRIYGTSRMLQWRVMQHYYHPTQQQHHDGSNSDYRWCYCFERFWAASYIELDPMLQWHPRLCVNTNVNPGPVCELMYPGRNPFFPDNGTNTVDSLGKFDTFETDLRLGPRGLRVPPGMIEQIEDDHLPPRYFPLYYQYAGQHATTYQQYEPYVLRLGPMRHGRLAEEGWFHIACAKPPHEDDVHFLYKPSDPEVLANMSYEDAKHHTPCDGAGWIGDRLITFSAFGASRLTVLGLQTNGTLASYDFPFQKSMACARYPTRVMYASRYTHSVPKSADQIFHIQTYHLQYMTRVVRTSAFIGILVGVVLLSCLVRCGSDRWLSRHRESLRSLSCFGFLGFAMFTAVWLWTIPLYMWIFPNPAFGIQMVGLGCVSFYVARALLSCGARTAEARKEAATEAANRVEGERLDSSRVNSPYTRRSESSNTVIGCRDSKDALEDTGGLRPTSPGSSLRPLDGIVTMLRQGHRTPTKAGSPLLPRARPAASPHAARSPAAAAIEGREEALEDGRLQGLKRDAMNLASQGATSHTGKPTELV